MKSVASIILMFLSFAALGQKMEGEITYETVTRWSRINEELTFLSKEEKDRSSTTWANHDEQKQEMTLLFNDKQSYYSYPKEDELSEGGYSSRKREFKSYRDFENGKMTDIIEMLGKTYIIEDSLKAPTWKVMNQIKEIAGYMCMMAVTQDTIRKHKITAWFADNIAVSSGPELYFGLPGMILELDINDGAAVTTAKEIKLRPVTEAELAIPKKLKGKKINTQKSVELVSNYFRDSMKAHRNPYWAIRY